MLFHLHILVGFYHLQKFPTQNQMKFHIDKEHMFPDQKDGKTAEGKTEIKARTRVKG